MPAEVCFLWLVYCFTKSRRLKIRSDNSCLACPHANRQLKLSYGCFLSQGSLPQCALAFSCTCLPAGRCGFSWLSENKSGHAGSVLTILVRKYGIWMETHYLDLTNEIEMIACLLSQFLANSEFWKFWTHLHMSVSEHELKAVVAMALKLRV